MGGWGEKVRRSSRSEKKKRDELEKERKMKGKIISIINHNYIKIK